VGFSGFCPIVCLGCAINLVKETNRDVPDMKNPISSLRKRLVRFRRFPQIARLEHNVFVLDPRNWIDNRLIARAPYETGQLELAKHLIARNALTHFIDIGANFGLYSIVLGHMKEIERVIAFEPVRRNFNQLCGNIFANRLDVKIQAISCALGASNGKQVIHIDPTSTGISRLDLASTARSTSVFKEKEEIEIRRGDEVLNVGNARIFMKIDVEGHTKAVLEGLSSVLTVCSGALQVEMEACEEDITASLASFGWRPLRRIQGDAYFLKDAQE
jgi:FkbM family methyltransferase